ncbi:molybdate ABC transporter permease subunit [Synechococcus sp. PCC 7336]|uniref:molybdate ABC transporter permease subunit n=1 Tax=Synechococcus sp. PCC 7336 TaxID=195250 RepID=UPI00034865B2|nr:molybdate ABC transporter permease subunit [Synechococcus sp. PCC 7336]
MIDLSPLWISLRIATIATAITFFLGIAAAHFMHRYRGRWRSLLDGAFLAPMVLPPTMLGFLLLLLLGKHGPLGALLGIVGVSIVFTWYAAIIAATVMAFPLMYKTVLGALDRSDSNLQQAARTLGASELRLFWRITLPLALPSILAGTTLAFARALGEFGATLMLAGNIPGKTQTIPMAIYFAVEAGAFGEAAAWAGVILAIALGGLALVQGWQGRSQAQRGRLHREAIDLESRSRLPTLISQSPPPASPSPSLSVALIKHLPGFSLDISFSTDSQPLGLLGASGAGKSLILRCIAGIETPDRGRIVLNGRVLFDSERGINLPSCDRRVGVLFQNYALFPHLSVAQNIAFGLPGKLTVRQRQQIVEEQLAAMQLEGMGDRYPTALSGGQQQRVAMARVLTSQPEVLLLDEPFSALDTHLRYLMERDLKLRLERFSGITLFVTHNIEEAYRICSNLLVMDRGRASAHDSKSVVLDRPKNVSAARLTGCKNISPAVPIDPSTIRASNWNCILQVAEPIPDTLTHIGIRAHQFGFLEAISQRETVIQNWSSQRGSQDAQAQKAQQDGGQNLSHRPRSVTPNTFPCWLAMTSETPHRMTLYLKLDTPPAHPQDYHLQAEIFKEKWAVLKQMPFPWSLVLDPAKLMMLSDG